MGFRSLKRIVIFIRRDYNFRRINKHMQWLTGRLGQCGRQNGTESNKKSEVSGAETLHCVLKPDGKIKDLMVKYSPKLASISDGDLSTNLGYSAQ